MANVDVNAVSRDVGQFQGQRFGPGLNFIVPNTVAVNPVLTVLSPIGASIGTQTPWQGRLTLAENDGEITRIIINVSFGNVFETAYMDAMSPDYSGASSVIETSPGVFDITLIRNGGWPGSPRIYVHANTDRGGMT